MAEDAQPHDVLLCLQTGKKLADENRMRYEGGQYYVKSPEEMAAFSICAGSSGKYPQDRAALSCGDRIWRDQAAEIWCSGRLHSWEYLNKLCQKGWKSVIR